jgi:hypothetical protein
MQLWGEELREVLARANAWIDESGADVVHVETLVLPGADTDPKGDASHETGEFAALNSWVQVIRVWFRDAGS